MKSREHVSRISAPVLTSTVRHQRQPRAHMRYEPIVVYMLAEQARSSGVDLDQAPGPWRPAERALPRPGRKSLDVIPVITNEHTEVMVDTMEHAIDVAGLLNWCGVHELNPVPEIQVAEVGGQTAEGQGLDRAVM
jgi:hypothetical protein